MTAAAADAAAAAAPVSTSTTSTAPAPAEPTTAAAEASKTNGVGVSSSNNNNNSNEANHNADEEDGGQPIYVLYGSATGNAEHIAKDVAAKLLTSNKHVTCCELDGWKKKCPGIMTGSAEGNANPATLLVVASTTGNGDPPENASRFVRTIKRKTTSTNSFQNVKFAVLGLGDTNYDQFCATGKVLDKKLAELGGKRMLPLACADEATGLEDVVEPWTDTVLKMLLLGQPKKEKEEEKALVIHEPSPVTASATTSTIDSMAVTSAPVLSSPSSSSIGVATVKSILGMPTAAPWEHEECVLDDVQLARAPSAPSQTTTMTTTTTTMHHALSNCELYHPEENEEGYGNDRQQLVDPAGAVTTATATHEFNLEHQQQQHEHRRSRGMSLAEDTVSTASTGFLYNASRPYSSRVVKARYLTHTDAAKVIASLPQAEQQEQGDVAEDDEAATIAARINLLDQHFRPANDDDDDEDRAKRVLELTLQLPEDMTIEYAPGDSLGVVVVNAPEDVRFVLDVLSQQGLEASTLIVVDGRRVTAREAVQSVLDLSTPGVPRRILAALAQQSALSADDRAALRLLSGKSKHGNDAYREYVEKQRVTLVRILQDFPSTQSVPWRSLFGMLTGIPPRYYSVSSSPLVTTNSLTIAFSVVDYVTPSLLVNGQERGKRRIRGVATRYMEALVLPLLGMNSNEDMMGDAAPSLPVLRIFPKPTAEFRLPASVHAPLILIGPGTGIAPFVGFVAHRQALMQRQATDRRRTAAETVVEGTWRGGYDLGEDELPVTPRDAIRHGAFDDDRHNPEDPPPPLHDPFDGAVDVYFGCRHKDHDWLYRDEMLKFQADGVISNLNTAFSRDSSQKVYVQHLMQRSENQARIADLILNRDARVYLCGDGNSMAKDVQEALVEVLASHLPGGADEARSYVERLKNDRRFLMDIWG
jgi:sulfite reductase alpha subunit-like flavoprotein